jgi:hypothetical protein
MNSVRKKVANLAREFQLEEKREWARPHFSP